VQGAQLQPMDEAIWLTKSGAQELRAEVMLVEDESDITYTPKSSQQPVSVRRIAGLNHASIAAPGPAERESVCGHPLGKRRNAGPGRSARSGLNSMAVSAAALVKVSSHHGGPGTHTPFTRVDKPVDTDCPASGPKLVLGCLTSGQTHKKESVSTAEICVPRHQVMIMGRRRRGEVGESRSHAE
jgi:hypothetical protein